MKPLKQRNILLNPGPVTTTETVKQALVVPDICHREKAFTHLVRKIRQDLLKIVNAGQDYTAILFAASGTGAIEACITSVVPKNMKIAIINNGSYGQRLIDIAQRFQIEVVTIECPYDQPLPLDVIEAKLALDTTIDCLAVVHHETSLGFLNPIHELGVICQRLQRRFIVDAMSSFAGVNIDVYRDHVDFLIASSNKCLHGMPGLSFVIGNKDCLLATKGNARSYYFDLHQQQYSLEKSGEMPFTPPVQIMYSLKQALDEYFAETPKLRRERYQRNYNHLINGLESLGFECVTPKSRQSHLLATVKFPSSKTDYQFDKLHDYLYERGYTIYPRKLPIPDTFRIACIGNLDENDMDGFLQQLKNYILTQAKPVKHKE